MIRFAIFLITLTLTYPSIAKPAAKETAKVNIPVLIEAINQVKNIANNCNGKLQGDLILNKMKSDFAMNSGERSLASDQVTGIYAGAKKCKEDGKIKINESAIVIIDGLKRRQLRDIGIDFIAQAQTTLEATLDNESFMRERSKLESIKNRIELEISIAQ